MGTSTVATIDETGVATPFTSVQAAGSAPLRPRAARPFTFIGGGGTYDPGTLVTTVLIPSQQGADTTGKYTSPTTLTSSGENVKVVTGASVTVD